MARWLVFAALVLILVAAPVHAAGITGQYLEARTTDVYTGPCFANADMNLTGKHAVMAWKVEKGTLGDVSLDGLSVVAVVAASDTLGLKQTGASKAVLIVDDKATPAQREALIRLARKQGGELVQNVVGVETAAVELSTGDCKEGGCATLRAGSARVATRCVDHKHDKACGNESAFYPPLARDVKTLPAVATEHSFSGKGLDRTWTDGERRSAYVGSFEVR
jgi:Protein of unknown function (DUF1326)